MQKASSQYAAECEESEKKAELEWEEKQAVARAQAAKKEKAAKDEETAKEQKKREKEQKRARKALRAEQKATKRKEHLASKTKTANKRRAQEGNEERPKKKKRVAKIYCTCRRPAGRKPMIGCDGCEEWYHFDCLGIDKEEEITALQLEDGYLCPTCEPGAALL